MYLTIWRHGEAGAAKSDRQRALTDTGVDDIGFGCQRFHEHCESRGIPHPLRILYSDWHRTMQTAQLIARVYNHAELQACAALRPGHRPADVDPLVDDSVGEIDDAAPHVLLVSHQPLVSALVDHYEGQPGRSPALLPGAFATLALDGVGKGCGRLVFLAQPPDYEVWR